VKSVYVILIQRGIMGLFSLPLPARYLSRQCPANYR
jgi:hypothetical protein